MAKTKMKKVVAMFAVLAMVATLVPVVAFASNTVEISTAELTSAAEPTIKVTGSLSGAGDVTMLAIRSGASLSGNIPSVLDEDSIMYVDQKDTAEASTTGWTFKLRDTTVQGSYITVFMGGTDVSSYDWREIVLLASAGTIALVENDKDYYVNGTQVLDLSGAAAGWLDEVTINVYDGETLAGSINKTTGVITLDSAPNEAKDYTIKFEGATSYATVADMTASVISADGAALAEYTGVATLDNSGEDAWTVTLPAGTADVTVTVTVDGVDKTADAVGGVLTVERAEEGGDAKTVVVTATAGEASKTLNTFTIQPKGAAAPAILAENVTLTRSAFSIEGARVATIKLSSDIIDPASATVKVGDALFFYSPERSKDGIVVFVAILRSDNTDEATVAAAASIENSAASVLYYAKPNDPTKSNAVIPADVNKALAMYKAGKSIATQYTDGQMLSADVNGSGNVIPASVNAILAAYKNKTKSGLNILK